MRKWVGIRRAALIVGLLFVVVGVGVLAFGLSRGWLAQQQVQARQSNDGNALNAWEKGGSKALAGATSGTPTPDAAAATGSACGGGAGDAYALLSFTGLPQYGYAGVAVNGNWTALDNHSMVHWFGSSAPGGAGNVIIAFHREPDYQNIDQLAPGQTVTIQDRDCTTYVYTVTRRWDLRPSAVNQLAPTSGHELTLISCTPWWQDYDRLVWRADLTSVNGVPVSS
jgi:hypothetical protein